MDFFEHQHVARKKTGSMVFLFLLAVIAIVVALNAVFAAIYIYGIGEASQNISTMPITNRIESIPPELYYAVTIVTVVIIISGSFYRILTLSSGGEAVATMVGARKVSRNTTDPKEKQLINVVDEMSIASGVTVPQVYVMDEEHGINAFAAGYKPNEAIVAVTRGTLEQLDRDELQGVVAHEFSHILNGDMRINIRLMGVLHGILIIGMIGGYLLRSMSHSRHRSSDGKNAGAVLLIGLALMIIGYAGVFFGRLIKAAISRQREFLADASAVQFTRNNEGITDALKKIGKLDDGSLVENVHAEELSHMFFGESYRPAFAGLFATHPPLIDRIKRLNKGRVPLSSPSKRKQAQEQAAAMAAAEAEAAPAAPADAGSAASIASSIGNPGQAHMLYAAALLASIPEPVSDSLALQKGAVALMFALVMDKNSNVRKEELSVLRQTAHAAYEQEVVRLVTQLDKLHARYRLPLFDMAIPVLKEMNSGERESLISSVKQVVDADRKIKLEELTVYILIKAHLSADAGRSDKVKYRSLTALSDEIALLLSLFAYLGKSAAHSPADVFKVVAQELQPGLTGLQLIDPASFNPQEVIEAMEKFAYLSAELKSGLVSALIKAVLHDNDVSTRELEVMRSVCAAMDVPVPPVLTDKDK